MTRQGHFDYFLFMLLTATIALSAPDVGATDTTACPAQGAVIAAGNPIDFESSKIATISATTSSSTFDFISPDPSAAPWKIEGDVDGLLPNPDYSEEAIMPGTSPAKILPPRWSVTDLSVAKEICGAVAAPT